MSNSAVSIATVLGDAGDIPIADAGGYFTVDNVEDALQQLAGGVGPATIYVATTGDDVTGDGSSGDPYETLERALQDIPRVLNSEVVIDVANGTYAESIEITGFYCTANGLIKITGDTSTPANVTFTGTVTYDRGHGSYTACARVAGCVNVELEGIRINATATEGVSVQHGAKVSIDRCTITGTLTWGLNAEYSVVELHGNISVSGFTFAGIAITHNSMCCHVTPGTITVTGPGTSAIGITVYMASGFRCAGSQSGGLNITITGVMFGFQLGLNATFQNLENSTTITIDNASTPGSSAAIHCTDLSSWSTNQAVVIDNFAYAYQANSISYIESAGSRTITNVGDTDDAVQNSVIYLP